MKQRIRYKKQDGKLVSGEIIAKNGARYIVFLDVNNRSYVIRNTISLRKYEGGEGINNLNVLKRNVKKHLQHLGVVFEDEKRNRTFGLCSRGFSEAENRQLKKKQNEISE